MDNFYQESFTPATQINTSSEESQAEARLRIQMVLLKCLFLHW